MFGLPETFIINNEGKIIFKHMGPLTEKILDDEISSTFLKLYFTFVFLFFSSYVLSNENLNYKIKKLTLELRCMTCQNQSVYDSDVRICK